MILMSLVATILFIYGFDQSPRMIWLSWGFPIVLVILMVVNFLHFTHLISWLLLAGSLFALLLVVGTTAMSGQAERGFGTTPFLQSFFMYVALIYVSLAQMKIFGIPVQIESESISEDQK